MNAQEIILEIEKLPQEEKQKIVDYVTSFDKELEFEDDDDVGLEEDIAEFDRRLKTTRDEDYISNDAVGEKILKKLKST